MRWFDSTCRLRFFKKVNDMAKGKIITQVVHESVFAYTHGMRQRIRRVICDGLAITHANGSLYVFPWEGDMAADPSVKVLKEDVEIHDELMSAVRLYMGLGTAIHKQMDELGCTTEAEQRRNDAKMERWKAYRDAQEAAGLPVVKQFHEFYED